MTLLKAMKTIYICMFILTCTLSIGNITSETVYVIFIYPLIASLAIGLNPIIWLIIAIINRLNRPTLCTKNQADF
jgi:di/tricarboxylate transporter